MSKIFEVAYDYADSARAIYKTLDDIAWKSESFNSIRYAHLIPLAFEGTLLVYVGYEAGWQGYFEMVVYRPKSKQFIHYAYTYGSCSVCDDWESRELSQLQIIKEMQQESVAMGKDAIKAYLENMYQTALVAANEYYPSDSENDKEEKEKMLAAFATRRKDLLEAIDLAAEEEE